MLIRPSSWVLLSFALLAGCAPPKDAAAPIGSPLPDLTPAELERFRIGEARFNHIFSPDEGLGPLFNENQCSACHTSPVTGGTGDQIVVKASHFQASDRCDALSAQGGENVRIHTTPLLRAKGVIRQEFPAAATERSRFIVPFVFGLGLVEAIPADKILAHADPNDSNRDGISGRPGRDARGNLGRFGRKAELASIRDFTDTALRFEMGLTTPSHPSEGNMGAVPFPAGVDPARDPEVNDTSIDRLVDFLRYMAQPKRRPLETAAEETSVHRGEELFHLAGCDQCHTPAFTTGHNEVAALSNRRVFLYSDLLLHDLGPQLAGICGLDASPSEWRTAMLMGLSYRRVFLHDGRAKTVTDAILMHGGEAELAKQRFRGLNELEREHLLTFLRTL